LPKHLARRTLRLVVPVAALVMCTPLVAQQPEPATQQREHVVRRGDTLWDLARAYLANPFLWPLIYEANRAVVENPHWIYPAERLIIPGLTPHSAAEPMGQPVDEAAFAEPPVVEEPGATTVVASLDLRRPIVPLAEYLAAPWLSTTAERQTTGRIERKVDPSAALDRLPSSLHPNERVLLSGSAQLGDSLLVVRFGRRIRDRGRLVEPMGVLLVDSVTTAGSTARLVRQFGEVRVGDVFMPVGTVPDIGLGEPEPVSSGLEGHLLQFVAQEPLHGTTDLAFITPGRAENIGIGDEFAVYVPSQTVATQVAVVRVIRVDDQSSTVRVIGVTGGGLTDGLPIRLIRRMP
jgi:hypothetical protein